jgi:hypothetical protein
VSWGDFPELTGETALLGDIRVASHDGFDRMVFEFAEGEEPNHRVMYVESVVQDGSGYAVDVRGEAFLEVRMTPSSGVDMLDGAGPVYTGPDRFQPQDAHVVQEMVRTGDFEGQLAWVAGLDRRAPFAVATLQDPLRIVVDVFHADES